MARTMQEKITSHLEGIATRHDGVEMAVAARWANTGTLYFQRGFDTLVEVDYSFQDSYATLTFSGRLAHGIDPRRPPWTDWIGPGSGLAKVTRTRGEFTFHKAVYGDQSEMAHVFGLLNALLNEGDETRGGEGR